MPANSNAPGVQVVAQVPVAGPVPPPTMVVKPGGNGLVRLLRANEMNMRVKSAGSENQPFAGDDFGGHADDHVLGRRQP